VVDAAWVETLLNLGGTLAFAALVYMELRGLRIDLNATHRELLALLGRSLDDDEREQRRRA
jgi:hypothetical protein